jgi:hypothetical protein
VLDSQGAFVAGIYSEDGVADAHVGLEFSIAKPRSRKVLGRGGRFESPVVHSYHVLGRTLRLDAAGGNVGGGLRERRALLGVSVAEGRLGPVDAESPSREGSFVATAYQLKLLVDEWLSSHSEASRDGREVVTTDSRWMQAARRWRHLCAARRGGP